MTETPNRNEENKVIDSLDYASFDSTTRNRKKSENLKSLSVFSDYGINMTSLQKSLINHNFDLGAFGPEQNGVDGFFGQKTFEAICTLQRSLGYTQTGVVDLKLIKLLFPYTFRTLNKKEGRSIKGTREYVRNSINYYNEIIQEGKLPILGESKKKLKDLKTKVEKSRDSRKEKQEIRQGIIKITKTESKKILMKEAVSKPFIKSLAPEKRGGMTYCSRTARKNLYRLGVPSKKVPAGPSAIDSMVMYPSKKNYVNKIENLPSKTNVLDLFIDSKSKYEHRAVAFLNSGKWYVLDPYSKLPSNKKDPRLPIPMKEYLASKKLMGAFPHVA